jgi:hypothetical protein
VSKIEVEGIFRGVAFIATDADLVVGLAEVEANLFFVAHPFDIFLEHGVGEEA